MKIKHYAPIVILLTLLLIALSAASFLFSVGFMPEKSELDSTYTVKRIFADRFPWDSDNMANSAKALGFVNDDTTYDEEMLNDFARRALTGSTPQNFAPHKAISEKSFADSVYISRGDFMLWLKDYRFTTEDGQGYTAGFKGFSGNYEMLFSAYCVRNDAVSEENAWRECSDSEYTELLGITRIGTNVYSEGGDIENEGILYEGTDQNDIYYNFDGEYISIKANSIAQRGGEYAYNVLTLSGFENINESYFAMYGEAIIKGEARAYINGELMLISIEDKRLSTLHLFYDLGTESFCGWIRE